MPENEFEKQVQQKMSELQFAPSPAAWEKVEKQIAEKKKRRRVLLWFSLVVLLSAGSGVYFLTRQRTVAAINLADKHLRSGADNKPYKEMLHDSLQSSKPKVAGIDQVQPVKPNERNGLSVHPDQLNAASSLPIVKSRPGTFINKAKFGTPRTLATNAWPPIKQQAPGRKNHITSVNSARTGETVRNEQSKNKQALNPLNNSGARSGSKEAIDNGIAAEQNISNDSMAHASVANTIGAVLSPAPTRRDSTNKITSTDTLNAVAKKLTPVKSIHRSVEWGISIAVVSSKPVTGFPGFHSSNSNAFLYAAPQSNGSGNVSNSNVSYSPSEIKNHFAWAASVVVRKPVGRTWSLYSGLQYTSYASGMEIGAKIADSTGGDKAVFRNGRSVAYTNHMHFLEIPVSIEKKLGVRSRFSIQTGLALAILAGTDQLRFDQQSNLYYADRNVVAKTQWSLLLAVQYRPLQEKIHWQIGPLLNYHLGNTFNTNIYGNGHWFFAGVQSAFFFGKAKK